MSRSGRSPGLLRLRPPLRLASAMIFAMHQMQVACIVRHSRTSRWFEAYLRDLSAEQRLIASVTSEWEPAATSDVRSPLEAGGDGICTLREAAPPPSATVPMPTTSHEARGSPRPSPVTRCSCSFAQGQGGWSRVRAGTRSGCAERARPASASRRSCCPSRQLPVPFAQIAPSRWCRSHTSSGRTCGWESRPRPSNGHAPSSGQQPTRPRSRPSPPHPASRSS